MFSITLKSKMNTCESILSLSLNLSENQHLMVESDPVLKESYAVSSQGAAIVHFLFWVYICVQTIS